MFAVDDSKPIISEQETSPKRATFATTGKPREQVIELEWPVEFDGVVYDRVIVNRMTGQQVSDFIDAAKSGKGDVRLPMFDCPFEVIDSLDADDALRVNEVINSFLPRVLRQGA